MHQIVLLFPRLDARRCGRCLVPCGIVTELLCIQPGGTVRCEVWYPLTSLDGSAVVEGHLFAPDAHAHASSSIEPERLVAAVSLGCHGWRMLSQRRLDMAAYGGERVSQR